MRYVGSGADKDHSSIRFNDRITLAGIPAEAHRYRLGSRTAVDWIIDRYQVKVDKSSGIVNDPKRSVPAKLAPHATSSTCGPPSTPTRWDQDDRLLPAATGHPRPAVGTCGGLLLVAMASHGAIFAVPDQAKMPPPGPVEVEACRPAHRRSGTWARRVVAGPEDPVGLHVQVIHNGASAHLRAVGCVSTRPPTLAPTAGASAGSGGVDGTRSAAAARIRCTRSSEAEPCCHCASWINEPDSPRWATMRSASRCTTERQARSATGAM